MVYAIRLGPMEDDEGKPAFWYLGISDKPGLQTVLAKRDEVGMRRLAKLFRKGEDLQCEPALAEAGEKFGFVSRPMPHLIQQGRGFIAYGRGLGPYGVVLLERDDMPLLELLKATAKFMKAQPWQWWSSTQPLKVSVEGSVDRQFEGNLTGFDHDQFGITLYENAGALDRMDLALKARDMPVALQEDGMAVTVTAGPEWAAEPMQDAYGFRGLPVPVRLQGGRMGKIDRLTLTILSAALEAASWLRPENLRGSADLDVRDTHVRVTIQAPAMLV